MIRHFLTRQFIQFLLVGGVAAVLHWLARWILSHWLPFSLAVAVAYAIGMAVAFLLNRRFVFPLSEKPVGAQARDFVLVNLAFFPLVWLVSIQLSHFLRSLGMTDHSEELAHAIAIPLPVLGTFLIYKFFAFKEERYE